jgi:hypothetical protein
VSNYLNELERETGCSIIRGKPRALKTDGLQTERGNGQRRASVHDFHSFRVTWITLALAAGEREGVDLGQVSCLTQFSSIS